jgi:hypothetical protein
MLDPKCVTQQQEIFTEECGFTSGMPSWLSIASSAPSRDTSSFENKTVVGTRSRVCTLLHLKYPVAASCTPD